MRKGKMFLLLGIGCVALGLLLMPFAALDTGAAEPTKPVFIGGLTSLTGPGAWSGSID